MASLLPDEREVFLVCDRAVVGKTGPFCTPVGGEPGLPVGEALKRALGERFKGEFLLEASEAAKGMRVSRSVSILYRVRMMFS